MIIDGVDVEKHLIEAFESEQYHSGQPEARPPQPLGWLPRVSHGGILVTTRNKELAYCLTSNQANILEISKLEAAQAEELIVHKLGNLADDLVAIRTLNRLLAYLPLAIIQTTAFMVVNTQKVSGYLENYLSSEQAELDLLDYEFCDVERDLNARNAVTKTLLISFNQINMDSEAAVLLYFLSTLDSQEIPVSLLLGFAKSFQDQMLHRLLMKEPPEKMSLIKALGKLKAFALITESDGMINMHRLVHVALCAWVRRSPIWQYWHFYATIIVGKVWPYVPATSQEIQKSKAAYLPHALSVLRMSLENPVEPKENTNFIPEKFLASIHHLSEDDLKLIAERYFAHKLCLLEQIRIFLRDRQHLEAALRIGKLVLELAKFIKGESHPYTNTALGAVGELLWLSGGDREQAADNLHQASNQLIKSCGWRDPRTISSTLVLATFLEKNNEFSKAERLIDSLLSSSPASENINLIYRANIVLCRIFQGQKRYAEAQEKCTQTVQICTERFGPYHIGTASAKKALGVVFAIREERTSALKWLTEAVDVYRSVLGDEHHATQLAVLVSSRHMHRVWGLR